mgnify:FL=1
MIALVGVLGIRMIECMFLLRCNLHNVITAYLLDILTACLSFTTATVYTPIRINKQKEKLIFEHNFINGSLCSHF